MKKDKYGPYPPAPLTTAKVGNDIASHHVSKFMMANFIGARVGRYKPISPNRKLRRLNKAANHINEWAFIFDRSLHEDDY